MDDNMSGFYYSLDGPEIQKHPNSCREASWTAYYSPVCNQVHEAVVEPPSNFMNTISLIEYPWYRQQSFPVSFIGTGNLKYSLGFTRTDPFLVRDRSDKGDEFVLKRFRSGDMQDLVCEYSSADNSEDVISKHSKVSQYIFGIYGACGTSVVLKAMVSNTGERAVRGSRFDWCTNGCFANWTRAMN
jgi:hypothetical protein